MSLWVDKHRPKDLAKLDYHDALTQQLSTIAESGNMPHMLVYGPSGAGKKTRVMALLKGIFGNSVHKLKIDQRSFKTPSKASVDVGALLTRLRVGVPRFHIVAATPRIRPATYAPLNNNLPPPPHTLNPSP
jgi:replication factor C subunit 3/5